MQPRKYKFNNSCLTIIFGDITESEAEVIVSSDDTWISMGGGLSKCLREKGGEIIRRDACRKLPASVGDVIVSTAGELKHQKYIFHCLTISYDKPNDLQNTLAINSDIQTYILQHSINKCFTLLHALDINSIAFPCIGAGTAKFPIDKVAEVMADAISNNLGKTQKQFNVELYLFDRFHKLNEIDYIDMFENFAIKSALAKQKTNADMAMLYHDRELVNTQEASDISFYQHEEMNHDVFISYSRKDTGKVNIIRSILEKHSINYWIDKDGIYTGNNIKDVIVDAIDCAKVVIFVSSESSNKSSYVIKELGYASQKKKSIIPVMLDNVPFAKSVRLDIGDIDQLDFTSDNLEESKLILSLKYHLQIK